MNLITKNPISKFDSKLINYSKKYKTRNIVGNGLSEKVILLGEGNPEDLLFTIFTHKLNGDDYVIFIKPEKNKSLDIIEGIDLFTAQKIRTFLLIIDKETDVYKNISTRMKKILGEFGYVINKYDEIDNIIIANVTKGDKIIDIITSINSIDDMNTNQHSIEDHLLSFSNIECKNTSKQTWLKLTKDQQETIFQKINDSPLAEIEKHFSQQIESLIYFKKNIN